MNRSFWRLTKLRKAPEGPVHVLSVCISKSFLFLLHLVYSLFVCDHVVVYSFQLELAFACSSRLENQQLSPSLLAYICLCFRLFISLGIATRRSTRPRFYGY